MFGLMNPGRQDRIFRKAYSRCCQHQRRRYGLPSLAFLSYESVLLYLCAVDIGKVHLAELPDQTCCRLRRLRGKPSVDEQEVARFCNSLGMLLAYIKLSDDLRDGPSLLARFAHWLLRGRFRETFDYFRRFDPAFEHNVNAIVAEHVALEQPGKTLAIEEYAQPTARAFGYVFSLMGLLPGMAKSTSLLESLGRHVGTAIIAFDCAVDWHKDQRRGAFNPLPDGEESVRASLALARQTLLDAAKQWRTAMGDDAHVSRVLEQVACRLPVSCRQPMCKRLDNEVEPRLQRWGLGRKRKGMQLNEGFDVFMGMCAFSLVLIGGVMCCINSNKQTKSQNPGLSDVAPTVADPAAQAAAASAAASTGNKKSGGCDFFCCDVPCEGCAHCDGCGELCNACDGCNGCDCSV